MKLPFLYSVQGAFICMSLACLALATTSHDKFFLEILGLLALSAISVSLEIKDIKYDPFNF